MTFMWDNSQPKQPDWWKPPSMFETSVYHKFRSPYTKIIPTRSDLPDEYLKLEPPSHDQIVAHSLIIHKILFSLLYGKVPELDLTGRLPDVTGFLADLVYYADYYAILDHVRPQIENWVKSLSGLWEDIRANARFWAGFSRLLLSEEIFLDTVKHLVGPSSWNLWAAEDNRLPHDVYRVANAVKSQLETQEKIIRDDIGTLFTSDGDRDDLPVYPQDPFPEAPPGRTTGKIRHVVKGHFSSWFLLHIVTERAYYDNRYADKGRHYWRPPRSYQHLYACAQRRDFTALTGCTTAESIAETYDLHLYHVNNCINKLFAKVEDAIKPSLLFSYHQPLKCKSYNGRERTGKCRNSCKCYQARCPSDEYFTFMMEGSDILPKDVWGAVARESKKGVVVSAVETKPADRAYQKSLGIELGQ
jgi:hypothetical protein